MVEPAVHYIEEYHLPVLPEPEDMVDQRFLLVQIFVHCQNG
ncbi:MAG: hypothetical protein ACLRPQ_01140 [Streptococcus sp.]